MKLYTVAPTEPCPLGGTHDLRFPIFDHSRSPLVVVIGHSCNKCHKTWDENWVPTYRDNMRSASADATPEQADKA